MPANMDECGGGSVAVVVDDEENYDENGLYFVLFLSLSFFSAIRHAPLCCAVLYSAMPECI